eukprot:SAG31_NODE_5001_length_2808_cov_1.497601_1_plen_366_part_10
MISAQGHDDRCPTNDQKYLTCCYHHHGNLSACASGPGEAKARHLWEEEQVENRAAVHPCPDRLHAVPVPLNFSGAPWTAGNANNFLFSYEVYDWGTPRFALMDGGTFWQQTQAKQVGEVVNNLSVAGVYLDQIGSQPPVLDCSPGRNRPLGGGNWWTAGYRQLLQRSQAAAGPHAGLFTEAGLETYIDSTIGYLAMNALDESPGAHGPFVRMVPSFQAVYAGYSTQYGRRRLDTPGGNLSVDISPLVASAGQQLVLGVQIGWAGLPTAATASSPHAILPAALPFLRDVLAYRALLRTYFLNGRLMRPLATVPTDSYSVPCPWPVLSNGCVGVYHAVWANEQNATLAAIFVTVEPQTLEMVLNFSRY